MLTSRRPHPSLRPFIDRIWSLDQAMTGAPPSPRLEHVLPTGGMHLVLRLNEAPLTLYEADGSTRVVGRAVVGGARSSYYVRDVGTPVTSVGAMLKPGAAEVLLGATAEALAERHTSLDALWGSAVLEWHEQIAETQAAEPRLHRFEALLASRLPIVHAMHPAVAFALERMNGAERIEAIVRATGFSHRHFIALFRQTVGLAPKAYARVLRFRRALDEVRRTPVRSLATIALNAGYSDQSHFTREFVTLAGATPAEYFRIDPAQPSHLLLPERTGRPRR